MKDVMWERPKNIQEDKEKNKRGSERKDNSILEKEPEIRNMEFWESTSKRE